MKVTFCAYDRPGYFGGPNAWLRRLLPDLQKQGMEITVLFLTSAEPEVCPTVIALENQGISCKAITGLEYTAQRIRWILDSLSICPPDVFVPHLMVPAFYASRWVKEAGIPTVGVLHSDDAFHYGLLDEYVFGKQDFRLSALVCVSKYLEHQVCLRGPTTTIVRRIPCGVPVPAASSHWSDSPLRLIYTGRLNEQQKRITEVVRALCSVVKQIPSTEAYLYGDGPERFAVENILSREGENLPVYLKGHVDSEVIQQRLLEGQVFVMLSDYEGLPISLMEAMACGLVPVCFKIASGIPELVTSGKNGMLVADRQDSFVMAVKDLKEDQDMWKRLSNAARTTIKNGYTHDGCVNLWIQLLTEVEKLKQSPLAISVPSRITIPPVHPGLAREDNRKPTGLSALKNQIKKMLGYVKRIITYCMPGQNTTPKSFLHVPCTPATLEQFIVHNAIERALRDVLEEFHGVLLDVGSGTKPYSSFITSENKRVQEYVGLDLKPEAGSQCLPDLIWDGYTIPFPDNAVSCAMATEVFEHVPDPEKLMTEILRVLKPGGRLFFSVPFLWRLHTVPRDEYRYTPFSLERHLKNAGFSDIILRPLGGADASLGQILALWVKGRSNNHFYQGVLGPLMSLLCTPVVWMLSRIDSLPTEFAEGCLITGLSGTALKPKTKKTHS
jgi:glycosyltransferase involved in cell wall biosynthesis/SAM-dependent methyltransferase